MLNNTIKLHKSYNDTGETSVSLIDTDNGSTLREINLGSGHRLQFRLQRQTTKENPTVKTVRHLVRISRLKPDESDPLKDVQAFVQLVIGSPQGGPITTAELVDMVHMLGSFLFTGKSQVDGATPLTLTTVMTEGVEDLTPALSDTVEAILAGHL